MFASSPFQVIRKPRYEPFTFAVYELSVNDGQLVTTFSTNGEAFDADGYSRFKYGHLPQIESYGTSIARALHDYFTVGMQGFAGEEIVLLGTPFKSLPNAAKLLTGVAERKLRNLGYLTSVSRIYQHHLMAGDYGTLSPREREQRNLDKKYSFDGNDFADKHVVLVDDVQITGSIARSVQGLLKEADWLSFTTINLVRLQSDVAFKNAQIENELNHAYVRSLSDLLPLMADRDQFILITRTVKRILEAESSELQMFLRQLNKAQLVELYNAVVDEEYNKMTRYEQSFEIISEFYPY